MKSPWAWAVLVWGTLGCGGAAVEPAPDSDATALESEAALSGALSASQVRAGIARSWTMSWDPQTSQYAPVVAMVVARAKTPTVVDVTQATDPRDALNPDFLGAVGNPARIVFTHDHYLYLTAFEAFPARVEGKLAVLEGRRTGAARPPLYLVLSRNISAAERADEDQAAATGHLGDIRPRYYYFKVDEARGYRALATGVTMTSMTLTTFGNEAPYQPTARAFLGDPVKNAQNTCHTLSENPWDLSAPSCATQAFGVRGYGDVFCGTFRNVYPPEGVVEPVVQAQGDADCAWALDNGGARKLARRPFAFCGFTQRLTGWACAAPKEDAVGWDAVLSARCRPVCGP